MLEVGRAGEHGGGEVADLAAFVDRLAAAGADRLTAMARDQIHRLIADGASPPGVCRLAEGLAASVTDRASADRFPGDGASIDRVQGRPAQGEGQPALGQLAQSRPAQSRPAQGRPAQSQPAQSQPAQSQPAQGRPGQGRPGQGRPGQGRPGQGRPAEGQPEQGQPAQVGRERTPRPPTVGPESIAAVLRNEALVVLEESDEVAVAAAIDALLADGRRIVVTGQARQRLDVVRRALPQRAAGRALDRFPALGCGELRELRRLLATSTPGRRARAEQALPAVADLVSPPEVAELCARAIRPVELSSATWMIPDMLAELDPTRRNAVTSVARLVDRSLRELPPASKCEWVWRLLSDLILTKQRAAFDRMIEDTAQAVAAVERCRDAAPVTFRSPPGPGALALLRQYRDFLAGGGRSRTYFRSTLQREVEPLLDQMRVDSRVPSTEQDVRRVVEHLELGEWLRRVCAGCSALGLPTPRDGDGLREINDGLLKVAAAVRSVSALRHDVLFLAENSPLAVPDAATAAHVAAAILDFEEHGSAAAAGRQLDEMADRLAARSPARATSPEHERACAALRDRDAVGYAAAIDSLIGAHREQRDEMRLAALVRKLGESAPGLAGSWTSLAEHSASELGMAVFLPMNGLLSALPPIDSADVVLVLGAADLGVEHLLLTAVAPRLVAVVGPGEQAGDAPTMLSVLERADAVVVRGRPGNHGKAAAAGSARLGRYPSVAIPVASVKQVGA